MGSRARRIAGLMEASPGLKWSTYAGGTSAAPGKYSYDAHTEVGQYIIQPVSTSAGRHVGYHLYHADTKGVRAATMGHTGLYQDLGMHSSPQKAKGEAGRHHKNPSNAAAGKGHWVTIDGRPVFIGGKQAESMREGWVTLGGGRHVFIPDTKQAALVAGEIAKNRTARDGMRVSVDTLHGMRTGRTSQAAASHLSGMGVTGTQKGGETRFGRIGSIGGWANQAESMREGWVVGMLRDRARRIAEAFREATPDPVYGDDRSPATSTHRFLSNKIAKLRGELRAAVRAMQAIGGREQQPPMDTVPVDQAEEQYPQDYATPDTGMGVRGTEMERQFDPSVGGGVDRDKIPAEDFAGKNRSFPIVTPEDVSHAARSIGRAGADNYGPDRLRANITRIARRKGARHVAALPDAWKGNGEAY